MRVLAYCFNMHGGYLFTSAYGGIISTMNKLFENVNHLLLVMIVGVASLAVTYVGEIAKNTQNMALSVQELNIKMGQVSEAVRDHELRLRSIENNKSTRR